MASEVGICSLGLSYLGLDPITSLTAQTKSAKECALHYPIQRDSLLEDHHWGFATKREALALLTDTYAGWTYAYQMPPDCIAPRKLYDPSSVNQDLDIDEILKTAKHVAYEVALSKSGSTRVLLTNLADATLIYTKRVTDCNAFTALFVEALSLRMGSVLAYPLRRDKQREEQLYNKSIFIINKGKVSDANAGEPKDSDSGDFVRARA